MSDPDHIPKPVPAVNTFNTYRRPSCDDYARVMWPLLRRGCTDPTLLEGFPERYQDMDHEQLLVLREMVMVGLRAMGITDIPDA